jgi:Zn-dependent alcohol dehydrogenase
MLAAVLTELNAPLEVTNIELTDIKHGQVLVKVLVSGICGSQLHEIRGHKGNGKFLPHLMGHEGYGIVESIGDGVTTVSVGDCVIMHWRPGAGIESDFPSYLYNGKEIKSGKVTTLSEYSIVSENRVTKAPDGINPEFAALLGCGLSTALAIVENEIGIKFGSTVTVIGCGGVGLNLIQILNFVGAKVFAVDKETSKKNIIENMGSTFYESDVPNSEITIDTTGDVQNISKYFEKTEKFLMVGQPAPQTELTIIDSIKFFEGSGKSIKATQGGGVNPQSDFPRYFNLDGKIDMSIVTHRFPLDKVNEAFDLLRTGTAGRIMINMKEVSNVK